jgi:hypothetical protein
MRTVFNFLVMPEIPVHDVEHIISSYIDNVENEFRDKGQYYRGFIGNINKQWFPLLSDEEIDYFKSKYTETVNRLFPKLPPR